MTLTDIIELELAMAMLEAQATVQESAPAPDASTLTNNPLLDY